jgi:hypothetical protein
LPGSDEHFGLHTDDKQRRPSYGHTASAHRPAFFEIEFLGSRFDNFIGLLRGPWDLRQFSSASPAST